MIIATPVMLRQLGLLVLLCLTSVAAHAEFFMADASYRLASDGKMYCSHPLFVGQTVMGVQVNDATGTAYWNIGLNKTSEGVMVSVTPYDGYEYVFETSSGKFKDGGCGGARSTLNNDIIVGMEVGARVNITFGNGYGSPVYQQHAIYKGV